MENGAPAKTRIYLTMLLGMVVMSFTSPLLKMALSYGATSEAVTLYRTLGVFTCLLPVVALNPAKRSEVKSYSKKHWILLLCLGTLKAMGFLFWIEGLKYTSVFVASTLTRTSPIWVIIGGYLFLNEKTAFKAIGGMLLSLVGVALIGISDITGAGNSWLGVILVMVCALVQASEMLVNRVVRRSGTLWTTMFCIFAIAAVEVMIYSFVTKAYIGPFSMQVYLVIAALAIFCTLLGQSVNLWVLKYMKAATVSIIQLISPFIAALTAFLMLNEKPGIMTFIGAIIMIVGLYTYFKEEAKETAHAEADLQNNKQAEIINEAVTEAIAETTETIANDYSAPCAAACSPSKDSFCGCKNSTSSES